MTPDPTWRERANCRGMGPDSFYLEKHDAAGLRAAREVCAGCTVTAGCLAEGMSLPPKMRQGIWGGLSIGNRSRLRDAV